MVYIVMQIDKLNGNVTGIFFHKVFRNRLKADGYAEEVKDRLKLGEKRQGGDSTVYVQEVPESRD